MLNSYAAFSLLHDILRTTLLVAVASRRKAFSEVDVRLDTDSCYCNWPIKLNLPVQSGHGILVSIVESVENVYQSAWYKQM